MPQWSLFFIIVAVATMVAVTESRPAPATSPISVMVDAYGRPLMFLRDKRTAGAYRYPNRAMMFTGYYRPVRRSNGDQATGVFAQGNAVSGQTYLGGMQPTYLANGPEPIDEPEISNAEAEAAPALPEEDHRYHEIPVHEDQPEPEPHQHRNEAPAPTEDQHEPEQSPATEFADPQVAEEPSTEAPRRSGPKKSKKTPVVVVPEEDEEEYDEEDEPVVPFVPFKGNRRRQGYPNLNNFFPMVFSFPRGSSTRSGDGSSESSPPGTITAIANSYSTGKSGIASSVATAYGGAPNGKKPKRPQQQSPLEE